MSCLIFHGQQDPIIPVEEARRLAAALQAARANVQYVEYAAGGHAVWSNAYSDDRFTAWLGSR